MILKNLLRRKARTLLTLIGIAIGVAAVVALGVMAEGFAYGWTNALASGGVDIVVSQAESGDLLFSAVDDTIGARLAAVPGVKQVAGVILGLATTPDTPYFFAAGLDPNEFAARHYKIVEGQAPSGKRQIILGRSAAKGFKKKIGDNFKVFDVSYRVVGIFETGSAVEEAGGMIPLKEAQDIFRKPRQVSFYEIQTLHPELTEQVIREITRRFPTLTASRSADFMEEQQDVQILRAFGWFVSVLAVLAGGLGMMNAMLMSVFERTREIGVLRALGWRRWRVLALILGEAVLLSLLGGILGIGLGVALIEAVAQVPAVAVFLETTYPAGLFVQAVMVALLVGLMGGFLPAWRAAQLQPVEAMRYEGGTTQVKSQIVSEIGGISLRNLVRQRTRTLLAMLAIGVGVGLVIALGGMADGMVAQFSKIGESAGELTVTEAKASDFGLAAIDERAGRWIAALPGVEHVSGLVVGIATMPGTPYFLAFGLEPTSFGIRHFAITQGERLRSPREVILGKVAAENLGKRVGDSLKIMGSAYRIAGIYETGIGFEDGGCVITLKEAQALFKKPSQVSAFGIKLRDMSQAEVVRQQIESRYPNVLVSKSSEFAETVNDIQTVRAMTSAVSWIALAVAGIAIMNAMLMSVHERTREIGTLRALGWRRWRVMEMIVRESLLLSFVSGLAGIVLGVGLGWVIGLEPAMGAWLEGSYSPELLVRAMLVALALGLVGALFPAWRAANLSPIEALRYE